MGTFDPREAGTPTTPLDYQRLYEYRLRDVDQARRQLVWNEIARYIHATMGSPRSVLDAAAGRGEFVHAVDAEERWAVDSVDFGSAYRDPSIKVVVADIFDVALPANHFEGVFVSNFLEHLSGPEEISAFLAKMRSCTAPGGRIAVLGPNFRYATKSYYDCLDHRVALTHVAVDEHLHATGWSVRRVIPRFIPYSFRGALPASPTLTRAYLRMPLAWRILGKQFLVIADRSGSP